jgi:hypothetical protein
MIIRAQPGTCPLGFIKMTSNARSQREPTRIWLLFNIWFSLLVIGVSASATLGVPISRVARPILILCSGGVIVSAIRSRRVA